MKITKLPNDWNPALKIKEESRRRCSVCPVCGESRDAMHCLIESIENREHHPDFMWGGVERINNFPQDGWYGPAKGDWLGWFIPSHWHRWRIDNYKCHTCGAEWDGDPYPTDIDGLF